jgi:hypothetical protein
MSETMAWDAGLGAWSVFGAGTAFGAAPALASDAGLGASEPLARLPCPAHAEIDSAPPRIPAHASTIAPVSRK